VTYLDIRRVFFARKLAVAVLVFGILSSGKAQTLAAATFPLVVAPPSTTEDVE
jgi:hypothetical protein